ncbi:MAG: bacteriohemerythrin [Deltaproteobacteria bacterium]|nr:bacteriohemerythrin [Deltaproteobacteria bacterium]
MDDSPIFWTDNLSTGVDDIDDDHKALFNVFQDAYWVSKTKVDATDLYCMMANLLNYTEVHFKREEALMAASPYPFFDKHCDIHQQLIKQLKKQIMLVQQHEQAPKDFVLFLRDWFIEHINGTDKRIEPYTRNNLDNIHQAVIKAGALTMQPFCHVHLVDDDPVYVELLLAMSEEAGLKATAYSSSLQFLQAPISSRDIIVLDLNMPDKDGIEVMRDLAEKNINPTFILVSGFDERVLQSARQFAESRQLNVADTLNKPVDTEIFIDVIKRVNHAHIYRHINTVLADPTGPPKASPTEDGSQGSLSRPVITVEELKQGLKQNEFMVHLQPQIQFSDGSICGVEALVRWLNPVRGLVFPDQIITLAEQNGLMTELTQVVIAESIKAYKKVKAAGYNITISINISAQNIVDLHFPEQLDVLIKEHDFEPEYFILELTESTILTDTSMALDIFNRLRMKGFSLSIDDFGTGDSSLKKLYESPFSELKIDRHFVSRMVNDAEANSIVRICTVLASEFNMTTVAEGVETQEEWDKLKLHGCDIAQGYFISKPLAVDDFISWAKAYQAITE